MDPNQMPTWATLHNLMLEDREPPQQSYLNMHQRPTPHPFNPLSGNPTSRPSFTMTQPALEDDNNPRDPYDILSYGTYGNTHPGYPLRPALYGAYGPSTALAYHPHPGNYSPHGPPTSYANPYSDPYLTLYPRIYPRMYSYTRGADGHEYAKCVRQDGSIYMHSLTGPGSGYLEYLRSIKCARAQMGEQHRTGPSFDDSLRGVPLGAGAADPGKLNSAAAHPDMRAGRDPLKRTTPGGRSTGRNPSQAIRAEPRSESYYSRNCSENSLFDEVEKTRSRLYAMLDDTKAERREDAEGLAGNKTGDKISEDLKSAKSANITKTGAQTNTGARIHEVNTPKQLLGGRGNPLNPHLSSFWSMEAKMPGNVHNKSTGEGSSVKDSETNFSAPQAPAPGATPGNIKSCAAAVWEDGCLSNTQMESAAPGQGKRGQVNSLEDTGESLCCCFSESSSDTGSLADSSSDSSQLTPLEADGNSQHPPPSCPPTACTARKIHPDSSRYIYHALLKNPRSTNADKCRTLIEDFLTEFHYDSYYQLWMKGNEGADTEQRKRDQYCMLQRLGLEALRNMENFYVVLDDDKRARIRKAVKAVLEEFAPSGPTGSGWAL